MKNFLLKLKDSAVAVVPVTAVILILNFAFGSMPALNIGAFAVGAVALILGMTLYTLGSSVSMEPMGEHIGAKLAESKKPWLILAVCFVVGIIVTVAEPDLTVLASQIASIPNAVLIVAVGLGVGVFTVLAVLRIFLKIKLNLLLVALYGITFIVAAFVPADYLSVAFDSGGVTTGPITVPFILALGIGLSGVAGGARSQEDSFGMVGICSVGPVLAVLILGLVYDSEAVAEVTTAATYSNFAEMLAGFFKVLPTYLEEVGIALAPIFAFFIIFQFIRLKLPLKSLIRIIIGAIYTYIGLTLFLAGANFGFLPAGTYIGQIVAQVNPWICVPVGAVVGAFLVLAEPAVHVLIGQVESITGGAVTRKNMLVVLVVAMAAAVALSMVRMAAGVSIWYFILPVYIAALALSFFVPRMFTAIAFDSGGVASGPMTAAFLLPFAMGACAAAGGNIITDAFGIIAFVAMTPLVAIQIMGLVYKIKKSIAARETEAYYRELLAHEGEIVYLE